MPLFSFRCTGCDTAFEALVLGSEAAACPECGSVELEQALSRVAPEPKSPDLMRRARACAGCEGHLSNFCPAEGG